MANKEPMVAWATLGSVYDGKDRNPAISEFFPPFIWSKID
jgi:hypothetical protein